MIAIFSILKKINTVVPFTESVFECKRGNVTIRGTEYRPEGENLPVAIVSHAFVDVDPFRIEEIMGAVVEL